MNSIFAHVIIVGLAIAAYVALTITGHDGNPVFVFIGGQAIGAGIQLGISSSNPPSKNTTELAPNRSTIK